jgi:hypothetical protein
LSFPTSPSRIRSSPPCVGFSSFRHRAILAVMTHRPGRIIGAMLTFFLGLVWFLREIYVATVSRRIGAR